jgi:hypothetical protein
MTDKKIVVLVSWAMAAAMQEFIGTEASGKYPKFLAGLVGLSHK